MKLLVAIPALNEEATIGSVLSELSFFHSIDDVLVIDDGSVDSTAQIARSLGAKVATHAINLGVGAALGTAFKFAQRNRYSHLVQLDADGQHRPEYLRTLVKEVVDADIVIGSRFAGQGTFQTTRTRRFVMRVIGWVVSRYTHTKLTDVTSGFRIAGPRAVSLFAQHYPVEYLGDTVESVILASKEGLRVTEVPVLMNERAGGLPSQSVAQASLHTVRIFFIMLLAIFRRTPPEIRNISSGVSEQ